MNKNGLLTIKKIKVYSASSNAKLAEMLGLSRPSVSYWMNGKRAPSIDSILKLEKLSKQYKVPFNREDFF